jgi:hypothetical protein
MSVLNPSRTARLLIKLGSLGLAGLIAGLLSGCTSATAAIDLSHNDIGWQTTPTYASATSEFSRSRTPHSSPRQHNDGPTRTASSPSGHHHAAAFPSL